MRSRLRTLALTAGAVAALCTAGGRAQQSQPQTPSAAPAQQPAQQQPAPDNGGGAQPVFRGGINFVSVDVIVSDKNGANIGDLKQSDFEITEDGKPQNVQTFKFIKLDGGAIPGPDGPPRQIRTDEDEEAEAAKDDVRLFAIFLDDYHVRKLSSMSVRDPLTKFVQTQLGPSDMIGLMYPLQSVLNIRMTRNHDAVVTALQRFTGRKYDYTPMNDIEQQYANYPVETVERIRAKVSLSALKGLIIHMGTLKQGRKSLIVVSEGFTYMVPPQLRSPNSQIPAIAGVTGAGADPITENRVNFAATIDMQQDLRDVFDEANRQNVSLYPVDPRGLAVSEFDVSEPSVGFETDRQYLNATMDSLRTLAENTDGRAIVNRNDLIGGMRQIIRDSSAYYLLGYSSSVSTPDGKFHEIKVRLKRPGLQVRYRKGYWAYTAEDAARALAPPKADPAPAVTHALANVASANATARMRVVRTWIGTSRGENGKTRVTFVWEPTPRTAADRPLAATEQPSRMSVMAVGGDGSPIFRGRVPDAAVASTSPSETPGTPPRSGSRIVFDAAPGKMELRLSVEGGSGVLDSEVREIDVPDLTGYKTALGTPELFRGRTPRDIQQMKADPQAVPATGREFSRTDRVFMRVPVYGAGGPTLSVHLLSRSGQAMSELPAAPPATPGGDSVVDVPLAALAPGEYIIELKAKGEGGEAQELVGFRLSN
jgi:VWFA-related protein